MGQGERETGRKGGREMYGRREKRGREAGEKGENYPSLRSTSQSKKNATRRVPTNTGREPGLKGTGSGRFKSPVPPPSYGYTSITHGDSPCCGTLWP